MSVKRCLCDICAQTPVAGMHTAPCQAVTLLQGYTDENMRALDFHQMLFEGKAWGGLASPCQHATGYPALPQLRIFRPSQLVQDCAGAGSISITTAHSSACLFGMLALPQQQFFVHPQMAELLKASRSQEGPGP